jgi:type II secretory pathway predicted ATPase ExeA
MYLTYYNLEEMPFQINTDPKFIWLGKTHREALAFLKYGALFKKGSVLITGDLGTGKTTLVNVLLEHFDKNIITAYIANPIMEAPDFLNCIGNEFNIEMKFGDKEDFLVHLSRFLNKCDSENKKVILIIDEAHRLSQELLDLMQCLSDKKWQEKGLLNIVFVGQDEFIDIISDKKNLDLKQNITTNFHINPLKRSEISEYILYRLNIAGSVKSIFTAGAIDEIFSFSKGYPRLINIMCDHALLAGHAKGVNTIDRETIKECADELHLWAEKIDDRKRPDTLNTSKNGVPEAHLNNSSRKVGVIGVLVLALIILGFLYYHDKFGGNSSKTMRYFRKGLNGQTELTSKDTLQIRNSDKNIIPVSQNSKNSLEMISELQRKKPNATRSIATLNPMSEEKSVDDKSTASIHVQKKKLNGSEDKIRHRLYIIYLHYSNEEHKKLMDAIAVSFKKKGFRVLGIEKVNYQNSDIRYFHSEDRAGALILKKYLTQFIIPYNNLKNTNIKIKNLNQKYPNAKKGAIEIWLNF